MTSNTTMSYCYKPNSEPYMYQTVPERLRHLAAEDPDREAFVFYNYDKERLSLTRKQLLDQSTNIAKHFVKLGIKEGTRVAICMSNSLEMLVAMMGITMAGGIQFFISPTLQDGSDLIEMMVDLEGEMLIVDTNEGDGNWKIFENIWPSNAESSVKIPSLKHILCNSTSAQCSRKLLKTLMDQIVNEDVELPSVQSEDHLAYFCTSGSTGQPKKVVYTHFGIMNWTKSTNKMMNITNKSRFFCDRTFSWVFGFPRTYFTEGTTRVFVDTRMSIAGVHVDFLCDIIEQEKCDVVYMPGYIASDVIGNPDLVRKFQNVDTIFMGGERAMSKMYEALYGKYCKRFATFYGTTECGGASMYLSDHGQFVDGIVGKPIEGMEVKIVDESGSVVPVGVEGELCFRSVWRFSSYLDMEDQFREVVDNDNWFHSKDIGLLQADSNIVVNGRIKEWISCGTTKFFPWSIEMVLRKIPGMAQAYAVGVPDPRLGQVVCACILPKPDVKLTEDDVKKFCDDTFVDVSISQGVSSKPRHFIIMDNVPLTRNGKVDRRMIGIMATERLNL